MDDVAGRYLFACMATSEWQNVIRDGYVSYEIGPCHYTLYTIVPTAERGLTGSHQLPYSRYVTANFDSLQLAYSLLRPSPMQRRSTYVE